MSKKISIWDLFFFIAVLTIIVGGIAITILRPKSIMPLENRTAYKFEPFSLEAFIDGSFQDNMEKALADQIPLSGTMKKTYRLFSTEIKEEVITDINKDSCENKYITYGDFLKFGCEDIFVYSTANYETVKEKMNSRTENIKKYVDQYKNIDFYLYYIERDLDINFETNKKNLFYENMINNLDFENIKYDRLEINNFEEYKKYFYRTDHHWNYLGSYEGYKGIMNIMDKSSDILKPINKKCAKEYFSGSKVRMTGANELYGEELCAYIFDMPQLNIEVNGKKGDYGHQNTFYQLESSALSYGAVYGYDDGQIIIDGNGKDNILIFGDSFDNAIIKLIAVNFDKTYSIDLRNYERTFRKKFLFQEYIKDKNITKVLFVGNLEFCTQSVFNIEG